MREATPADARDRPRTSVGAHELPPATARVAGTSGKVRWQLHPAARTAKFAPSSRPSTTQLPPSCQLDIASYTKLVTSQLLPVIARRPASYRPDAPSLCLALLSPRTLPLATPQQPPATAQVSPRHRQLERSCRPAARQLLSRCRPVASSYRCFVGEMPPNCTQLQPKYRPATTQLQRSCPQLLPVTARLVAAQPPPRYRPAAASCRPAAPNYRPASQTSHRPVTAKLPRGCFQRPPSSLSWFPVTAKLARR